MRTLWGVLLTLVAYPAAALVQSTQLADVAVTVYAPDWTWQQQPVNVLFVFENGGYSPASVSLTLEFPQEQAAHFTCADTEFQKVTTDASGCGAISATVEVPPGQTLRRAFTGLIAKQEFPRRTYEFKVHVRRENEAWMLHYPLKTVRGAIVNNAQWALYAPVGIALIWSGLLALALRMYAKRAAVSLP